MSGNMIPDPEHFRFSLDELTIDRGDIERLMGYEPGESPDPFPGIIENIHSELADHCEPQGGYIQLGTPKIDLKACQTVISEETFQTDRIVTRMLRNAESLAIFICTAGPGIERWTKQLNGSGDPVSGFVIDAFGSKIADAAAQKLQEIIEERAQTRDQNITNRYSPGYCGWPVKDQHRLFSFFPKEFCGISLSESSLMHPIKSVSGMIGIGSNVRFNPYTCDACKDEHCIYRRLKPSRFNK